MARSGFKMKSGNATPFKQMGATEQSPIYNMKTGDYSQSFESPVKQAGLIKPIVNVGKAIAKPVSKLGLKLWKKVFPSKTTAKVVNPKGGGKPKVVKKKKVVVKKKKVVVKKKKVVVKKTTTKKTTPVSKTKNLEDRIAELEKATPKPINQGNILKKRAKQVVIGSIVGDYLFNKGEDIIKSKSARGSLWEAIKENVPALFGGPYGDESYQTDAINTGVINTKDDTTQFKKTELK